MLRLRACGAVESLVEVAVVGRFRRRAGSQLVHHNVAKVTPRLLLLGSACAPWSTSCLTAVGCIPNPEAISLVYLDVS